MAQSSPPIVVKVTHRGENAAQNEPRQAFWASILARPAKRDTDRNIDHFEAKLFTIFPQRLRQELLDSIRVPFYVTQPPQKGRIEARYEAAIDVFFHVESLRYGSLEFSLWISDVEKAAEAFNHSVEFLEGFLATYVPAAFTQTFDDFDSAGLMFEFTVPNSLKSVIRSGSGRGNHSPHLAPTLAEASTQFGRAGRTFGALARTPLLWVVLTLVIVFFGFREHSALYKPAMEHQLQLLSEDRARIMEAYTLLAEQGRKELEASKKPEPAPPMSQRHRQPAPCPPSPERSRRNTSVPTTRSSPQQPIKPAP